MKLTLLGTGDAIGTPKIGCSCPQCTRSQETGETRLRTSLLLETDGRNILIDTSPDLRLQLLNRGSPHIDAVLWTHGHYDHFIGFGEFYRIQKMPPVYADPRVISYCSDFFPFLSFQKHPVDPCVPFDLFGLRLTLLPVTHPPACTCGVLIETGISRIGYTSDTNRDIPQESIALLKDLDLLLVDALVPDGVHIHKHMNYRDACRIAEHLSSRDYRCVHMSHMIPWDTAHTGKDGETFLFD
jgi:phosphoribosyl 1,2-cyclic phosphate phosphodiesterase